MSSKKINVSKTDTQQIVLNNLNQYVIKIHYFNQKGAKNFEDNIPLKYIFSSNMKLPEKNINRNYF